MDRLEVPRVSYEEDFLLWLEPQVSLLRVGRFELLDVDNITEELEGTMRSERRELENRLDVLMTHLLKCQFQPQRKSRSWTSTLGTQRTRIKRLIRDSPSLRNQVLPFAQQAYRPAMEAAHEQTGLPLPTFPDALPYTQQQLLDNGFVP
ncbi:DUF29 domain-containing protein [Massilia antarctica]|uniref:DUF29 domain-containing protein n=1 Tax=Massilia antarctica TaxID=2765360 RepID=UPI0006BB6226|nr:DUF29 domain-containing protein [Massilia sp. H27-R4]MCY0911615.1 DUF29 domain-containing protein [Massilia sp. H27-R4]CUI04763.1 hypothetical protein BN2497_4303 [Janthinobacterium sp. CG23_2]CUU28549.1 hypothetical protein BN3177_4303 [Janthinobacterium sp. CG23_2]